MIDGIDHAFLLKFLAGFVGDDAEDVAQETYLRVLTARRPYQAGGATKSTWVLAIAKREALRWRRRQGRRPGIEGAGIPRPMAAVPSEYPLVLDGLCDEDRLLWEARLATGSLSAAARALGLTRDQARWRWTRMKGRVQ